MGGLSLDKFSHQSLKTRGVQLALLGQHGWGCAWGCVAVTVGEPCPWGSAWEPVPLVVPWAARRPASMPPFSSHHFFL